jgi:hypothetical protein
MADPHVISALREKRAELSGELIAAEKRILQLRDDIDRTIRVFDPTSEPHKIRPILRRKKPPSFLAVNAAERSSTCCASRTLR